MLRSMSTWRGNNRRFARVAAEPEDYHRRRPSASELRQIFRLETERRISHDWVLRHNRRLLQLQPKHRHYGPTQAKALVCEWEDGTLEVYYRGERLAYQELAEPLRKARVEDAKETGAVLSLAKPRPSKPSQDHPWRQGYEARRLKRSWSTKTTVETPSIGTRMEASR
jgi:hypothetical protein